MAGTNQFNAYFGCDWCLQKGQYYGGSMRYPYTLPFPKKRTMEMTIRHAEDALVHGKPVYGIKRASPLLKLKKYNIIKGFCPGYMHFLLLGVGKQLTEYILVRSSVNVEYSDSLILKIKAAYAVGRLTRSLSQRDKWKAKEWENWILYFSVPIFTLVITDNAVLQHWCLLVDSVHIILRTDLDYGQLNRANELLYKFLSETEELYSLAAMTYNVHQCLHVIKSIIDRGPIWAHSAFGFESANHSTILAIKSGQGVLMQIIRYLNIKGYVDILTKKLQKEQSGLALFFIDYILNPKILNPFKLSYITYLGTGKKIESHFTEKFMLPTDSMCYSKIIYKNCLFASST